MQQTECIDTQQSLEQFCQRAAGSPWLTFDTEFIGEKYYRDRLCVISAGTEEESAVIDVLALNDLSPFIKLLEDPGIQKVTHAGENDYRILIQQYDARPRNLFDTQLCAAFLEDHYPSSLQNLALKYLGVRLSKASTVSDWEKRPLSKEQMQYALDDVDYLPELARIIRERLENKNRLQWALEECQIFENVDFYRQNDLSKELRKKWARSLTDKKALFLWKLINWREKLASERNKPRKWILSDDRVRAVVELMGRPVKTVQADRRLSQDLVKRHWNTFERLYAQQPTEEEKANVAASRKREKRNSSAKREALLDTLYNLIKYKATEEGISPEIIISRRELNRMKKDIRYLPDNLQAGWRKEVLGETLLKWLQTEGTLQMRMEGERCILEMKS